LDDVLGINAATNAVRQLAAGKFDQPLGVSVYDFPLVAGGTGQNLFKPGQ